MQDKVVVPDKVEKLKDKDGKESKKKFKIKKEKNSEIDIEIDVEEDGTYEVDKLSIDGLPTEINGKPITWLNNFAIKQNGSYINKRYKIKIPGIAGKEIVIIDNNSHGIPYIYTGPVEDETITMSDGDPGIGTI